MTEIIVIMLVVVLMAFLVGAFVEIGELKSWNKKYRKVFERLVKTLDGDVYWYTETVSLYNTPKNTHEGLERLEDAVYHLAKKLGYVWRDKEITEGWEKVTNLKKGK